MPTNDFLPWATLAGANVVDQPTYAADGEVSVGFAAGLAFSNRCNKVWRQATFPAAALSQLIMQQLNVDVRDNGDLNGYVNLLLQMLQYVALHSATPRNIILPVGTTNFYVNASSSPVGSYGGGNDGNNGTAIGSPWQTLQHAVNTMVADVDFDGNTAQINCADGAYQPFTMTGRPIGCMSPSNLVINGNTGTPTSCTIAQAATTPFNPAAGATFGAVFTIQGFSLSWTNCPGSGAILFANNNSVVQYQNINFGSSNLGFQVAAINSSEIYMVGSYVISAGGNAHWSANNNSQIVLPPNLTGTTVTLSGTPPYATGFAVGDYGSIIQVGPGQVTYSGAATGPRYLAQRNGIIAVPAANVNFFPGSVAGTSPTGLYTAY